MSEDSKDLFLIAHQIKQEAEDRDKQFIEHNEVKNIMSAYRKVEDIKTSEQLKKRKNSKDKSTQPTSSYATKIKETLRELNVNKNKQYEKIKESKRPSEKHINSLQVNPSKTEKERKLCIAAARKIFAIAEKCQQKKRKKVFQLMISYCQLILENDLKMARKYRLYRLFSCWKQEAKILKKQNEKERKQRQTQLLQSMEMAVQFHSFVICKKAFKGWASETKKEKKRKKYERQIHKAEIAKQIEAKKQQALKSAKSTQSQQGQLQGKLRGFIDNLKNKIESKESLKVIKEKTEESELQTARENEQQKPLVQADVTPAPQNDNVEASADQEREQISTDPKRPLTNQDLEKRRRQIAQRSKNRKKALDKLKKQKEQLKRQQEAQALQLEKLVQEEEKKRKEHQYKQFQRQKRLQKEWEEKQRKLNIRAEEFNRIRLMGHFGMTPWVSIKSVNQEKAKKLTDAVNQIMTKYLASEVLQRLEENMCLELERLAAKCNKIHQKNVCRRAFKAIRHEHITMKEQKQELEVFHQAQIQKTFFKQWVSLIETLRMENIEQQRPLIRKAHEYRKVSLQIKAFRCLSENKKAEQKEKLIEQQKKKIKSKIEGIISEKIQINFDEFL